MKERVCGAENGNFDSRFVFEYYKKHALKGWVESQRMEKPTINQAQAEQEQAQS
ncbi:MAG: hypothetical protein ACR2RF_15055 [Geminicoccaceae bacterium]